MQQMLMMAQALMRHPKLLAVEEPPTGSWRLWLEKLFEVIHNISA